MAQPSVCTTCYGTNLVLQGGFLTCADCGTQAQTILEETEYGDAGQGRARRAIRAPRAAGTGAPDDSAAQQLQRSRRAAEGAALLYARALQALARHQARALCARLGAHADVEILVRQLWLPAVAASGLLEPGTVERAVLSPPAAAPGGGQRGEEEGAEGEDGRTATAVAAAAAAAAAENNVQRHKVLETRPEALHRRFGAALPAQTTLAVAFAALALLREPVVPADVLTWALDGRLPFAELPTIARPLLRRAAEEEEAGELAQARGGRAGSAGGGTATTAAGVGGNSSSGAAALAAGALRAQVTMTPAQLAERAEQLVELALRAADGEDEEGLQQQQLQRHHQRHALPPANGEALLRRLARDLAAATATTTVGCGYATPSAAAMSLAVELHDMYLLGTPSLAFVRDPAAPFGAPAATAAGAASGAPALPKTTAATAGPWAEGAGPSPLQARRPTAAAGGAAGGQDGGSGDDESGTKPAGASLPMWVGQGMGRHAHPFAAVAAALIVALKLLHGSLQGRADEGDEGEEEEEDGRAAAAQQQQVRQRARPSVLPGPAEGWQRWASRAVRRGPQPRAGSQQGGVEGEEEEGGPARLGAARARRAFLLEARRRAFSASGPPEALEDVQRVLLTLAQVGDEEQEGGEQQRPQREGGGNKRPRQPQDGRRRGPHAAAAAAALVSESAADGRYLLAADAATARAPPDYVAVLAAVAAHAHTDPFTLHALVRQLERRMLAAEASLRGGGGGGGNLPAAC